MPDQPTYAPEWLEFERQTGGRQAVSGSDVQVCRDDFAKVFASIEPLLPPPSEAVRSVDEFLGSGRRVRVYTPRNINGAGLLPLGLYIHSGGWFTGSIEAEDYQCRFIAEHAQMIIFSPEYRLAPEDPYPAGLEDCCAAYEYMHEAAGRFGGDSALKFVMGGSAGGNLTACVALEYTTDPKLKPAGIIAACMSSCDQRAWPAKYKAQLEEGMYEDTPMINAQTLLTAREWYNAPPSNPLHSPLLHSDIKQLPLVHIAATTADPTHMETLSFYQECESQGVKATLKEWVGWPHFFWIIPMLSESKVFMDEWCEVLRDMVRETKGIS